jgi:hypothetical protein
MLSIVLLTTSLAVTFLHRYLEAPATEQRLTAAKVLPPD